MVLGPRAPRGCVRSWALRVDKDAYVLGKPAARILKNEGLVPSPHLSQTVTLNLSRIFSDVHKSEERYSMGGGEERDLSSPCPLPSQCGPTGEIPGHHGEQDTLIWRERHLRS